MSSAKVITRSDIRVEYETTPTFYKALAYHGDKLIHGVCIKRDVYPVKRERPDFKSMASSLEIDIAQYIRHYNEQIKKEKGE